MLTPDEEPIFDALRAAGVAVEDLWTFSPNAHDFGLALPVLVEHLERGGYPAKTTNWLGQVLCRRATEPYWDRLKAVFLAPRSPAEEEAAAIALSGAAGPKQFDELVELAMREDRGVWRVYFLRPINRIGRERGRAVIAGLVNHPVLGAEATAISKGRGPND